MSPLVAIAVALLLFRAAARAGRPPDESATGTERAPVSAVPAGPSDEGRDHADRAHLARQILRKLVRETIRYGDVPLIEIPIEPLWNAYKAAVGRNYGDALDEDRRRRDIFADNLARAVGGVLLRPLGTIAASLGRFAGLAGSLGDISPEVAAALDRMDLTPDEIDEIDGAGTCARGGEAAAGPRALDAAPTLPAGKNSGQGVDQLPRETGPGRSSRSAGFHSQPAQI